MGIADRLHDTIEQWQGEWKGRVAGWVIKSINDGVTRFLLDSEPLIKAMIHDPLARIISNPNTPPEIKKALEDALGIEDWQQTASGWLWYILGIAPAIFQSGTTFANLVRYDTERLMPTARLDPLTAITAWRRDKEKYAPLLGDLKDLGWDDARIEALLKVSEFYPAPADLIRWQAREVFEPDMIERYGLDSEFGAIDKEPFYKAGMTDDQILNYWRAHWEHASWQQVVEMLHRGLMTEDQVRDWFRVVEIPPFWRDLLIQSAYTWPTRVDVRRWWDMRTIDETELRRLYSGMGYRGANLDNYVLWTKVYVAFPDLMARWTKGWITIDDVRRELTALGMPAERVEEMIQMKVKPQEPERITGERDVTKTDIYKGVKQGVITRGEGAELLQDLGFDEDEADYLLAINIPPDEEVVIVRQRELSKGDIKAAVKEQIITPSQAIDRLIDLRYGRADADFLVSLYERLIPIEAVEESRELTKGDIVKGLRKGILGTSETQTLLTELGYSLEDAKFLVESNIPAEEVLKVERARQLAKTDIRSAFNVGLITASEASARLEGIGYSSEDAQFLMSIYIAVADIMPVTKGREASKTDIVKGVKKGLITNEEAYLMLLDIGFTPEASVFILDVHVEESPFSPINYTEFKELTGKYRLAAGREEKPMPEELKKAADKVVQLTTDLESLRSAIEDEERLVIDVPEIPEAAAARLKKLQVKANRAESTLALATSEYKKLLAEWKNTAAA